MAGKDKEKVNIYEDEDDTAEERQDSHEAAPSSSRDSQATRDAQRAHEEGVARAAKITSENWLSVAPYPVQSQIPPATSYSSMLTLILFKLIDPKITAEAAIEALKKRGHWHPDENGIPSILQALLTGYFQPRKNTYQPEKVLITQLTLDCRVLHLCRLNDVTNFDASAESKRQEAFGFSAEGFRAERALSLTLPSTHREGVVANRKDQPQSVPQLIDPVHRQIANFYRNGVIAASKRIFHLYLPLVPCLIARRKTKRPALTNAIKTRDRKEQKKRSAGGVFPIAEQDLIKCKHFAATEAGIPIRVESGTMICVDYKDYSKMDIYAIHLMPDSPCIDDIVIIISKSNVAFARIAAAQSPEHALLNCKRLTSALNPWMDRSEPISVFVFCPRNEAGEPFYITPHKNDRLNAVYKHFQDFSKGSGTILSDSYFPVPSGGMYCSIKVGPFGEGNDGKVAKNANKASVQGSSAMSLGNKKDLDFNFGQNVSLDSTQGSSQDYDLGISSDLNLWFDSETGQDWLQNFELESFQNTEPENPPVVDSDLLTRLDKLHEMTGEIDQPWSQQEALGQNNSFPSTNQNHSTGNGQDYMDFGFGFDQQFGQLSSLQKSNQPFGQTFSLQELNQPFGFELFGQSAKTLGQKSSKASSQKYDDNPYREFNPKFDRQPTGRPRVLIMDRNGQRVL
ncbi:hypothetical protein BGW36DRAFT_365652 [Talaromyces proteolyticus]|uniref:Uncharacterized protein n=1 Tax=Talaromyces proteolyticus TaxID=1131652 RepID=A0AAD4KDP1_9EURO|nr:uncharacterized protein BGW36DRAFT_365652 [Talaromyces proteolyticus]KAH8689121.1 hypothetical protein BGW36DRAFT_365652 [Talaromyces proteolyticus]